MSKLNLDNTSKVVSIVSVVVAVIVSIVGFFSTRKANQLQEKIQHLEATNKELENSKEVYNTSPRITAKFDLLLARAFAEEYMTKAEKGETVKYLLPTKEISRELIKTIPNWKRRRGLMTGEACGTEGLKARQVVTLLIKNIGFADATDVKITAKQKICPSENPLKGWYEFSAGHDELGYPFLQSTIKDWPTVTFAVEDLLGQGSPKNDINEVQVVLASVSATTLFGTVLVPVEISWKNKMNLKQESQQISDNLFSRVSSDLTGAQLGNLGSICP